MKDDFLRKISFFYFPSKCNQVITLILSKHCLNNFHHLILSYFLSSIFSYRLIFILHFFFLFFSSSFRPRGGNNSEGNESDGQKRVGENEKNKNIYEIIQKYGYHLKKKFIFKK